MKRVRVYVVIDVEEDLKPEEVSTSVADVLDGIAGEPLFVFTAEGYENEFESFGADPSSWEERESSHPCSLDTPCGLCKRRKELERIFVCGSDAKTGKQQTLCSSCLASRTGNGKWRIAAPWLEDAVYADTWEDAYWLAIKELRRVG